MFGISYFGHLGAISLGADSMQHDQGALKPRSCTGRREVGHDRGTGTERRSTHIP
jgi:hypothetical protein